VLVAGRLGRRSVRFGSLVVVKMGGFDRLVGLDKTFKKFEVGRRKKCCRCDARAPFFCALGSRASVRARWL
jgi:hypothetical protein